MRKSKRETRDRQKARSQVQDESLLLEHWSGLARGVLAHLSLQPTRDRLLLVARALQSAYEEGFREN